MSLSFYLETDPEPYVCSECGHPGVRPREVFQRSITHNLGKMATEAGIYKVLWRPNDGGQVRARDIVLTLQAGLAELRARPAHFKQFDSPNGWGLYDHFVPFVQAVLDACVANPDALVRASV